MKRPTVFVCGQKWTLHLVRPKNKNLRSSSGQYLSGQCFYDRCRIYLADDQSGEALEDTILHELLHALLHVSGAEEAYGRDADKDEHLVTALTPHLHRLLKDLGFQFPILF